MSVKSYNWLQLYFSSLFVRCYIKHSYGIEVIVLTVFWLLELEIVRLNLIFVLEMKYSFSLIVNNYIRETVLMSRVQLSILSKWIPCSSHCLSSSVAWTPTLWLELCENNYLGTNSFYQPLQTALEQQQVAPATANFVLDGTGELTLASLRWSLVCLLLEITSAVCHHILACKTCVPSHTTTPTLQGRFQ